MDAGVPDVADGEAGYEFKRLGPVDSGVTAHRRVAGARLAHGRLLGWSEGVVHPVAPGSVVADAIRRIGRQQARFRAIEQSRYGVWIGGVAAQESMVAENPQIAELGPRGAGRLRQGLIEIEALDSFALLADLERAPQIGDLVFPEARQA
jgi:hypothetical protein